MAAQPRTDEPIDAFLERVSRDTSTALGHLHRYFGIGTSLRSFSPAVVLPEPAAQRLANWTALPVAEIHRHTLIGAYPALIATTPASDRQEMITAAHSRWFFLSHSRFCPRCLAEHGTWRLEWRLPWAVACPTHHTLLVDTCPACGQNPRQHRTGVSPKRDPETPVDPTLCQRPEEDGPLGWNTPRCHAPLHTAQPAESSVRILNAQVLVLAALSSGTTFLGTVMSADAALTTIIDIVRLTLRRRHTGRRLYPLRDLNDSVQATLAAAAVLSAADPPDAAAVFRHQAPSDSDWTHNETLKLVSDRSGPLKPVLDQLLAISGRVTTQLRRHQLYFPVTEASIDQVPLLMWPRLVPQELMAGHNPLHARFLMSLSVARMIAGTWDEAAQGLGFQRDRGRAWSKYLISQTPKCHRHLVAKASLKVLSELPGGPRQPRAPLLSLRDLSSLPEPISLPRR